MSERKRKVLAKSHVRTDVLKLNKTNEEQSLEETLFGKDIVQDLITKRLVQNIPISNEAVVEEEEDIEFNIDTIPDEEVIKSKKRSANEIDPTITTSSDAVWHDDDDDELMINLDATNRLKKLKTASHKTSVVTGQQLSELLQKRFEPKKAVWSLPTVVDREYDSVDILDEEDYQLLNDADSMVVNSHDNNNHYLNRLLPMKPERIHLKKMPEITSTNHCAAAATAIQFHPNPESNLFVVGSLDHHLRIFRLHSKSTSQSPSELLTSVQFKDMGIHQACFNSGGVGGSEVVISGRKPYYYVYDLEMGRLQKIAFPNGCPTKTTEHMITSSTTSTSAVDTKLAFLGTNSTIHIADGRSKQWITDLHLNSSARSACFIDEYSIIAGSVSSELYHYDLRNASVPVCTERFVHDDGSSIISLAAYTPSAASSAAGYSGFALPKSYLAVGGLSGVLSVYEGKSAASSHHTRFSNVELSLDQQLLSTTSSTGNASTAPMKSLMNITTKVTTTKFHPSGQLLAYASGDKKDCLKLVHLPSCTVFANWPQEKTYLQKAQAIDFSPDGSKMAIANAKGRVLLYSLSQFAVGGGSGKR